jgi:hypothetical protein
VPEREPLSYFGGAAPVPRVLPPGAGRSGGRAGLPPAGPHRSQPHRLLRHKNGQEPSVQVSGEVALPASRPGGGRVRPNATHTSLTEDKTDSRISSQAILDVVHAVRSGTPWPSSRENRCHLPNTLSLAVRYGERRFMTVNSPRRDCFCQPSWAFQHEAK